MKRRTFLKNTLMTAAVVTTFAGLMIKPKRVFAAWPKESFDITDLSDSIKSVYGHDDLSETSEVNSKHQILQRMVQSSQLISKQI